MGSLQKLPTFFSKNISVYAIFNDQSFNDTLTNDIVSCEQQGPDWHVRKVLFCFYFLIEHMFLIFVRISKTYASLKY